MFVTRAEKNRSALAHQASEIYLNTSAILDKRLCVRIHLNPHLQITLSSKRLAQIDVVFILNSNLNARKVMDG